MQLVYKHLRIIHMQGSRRSTNTYGV